VVERVPFPIQVQFSPTDHLVRDLDEKCTAQVRFSPTAYPMVSAGTLRRLVVIASTQILGPASGFETIATKWGLVPIHTRARS
jgi:hypothetical protein